MGQESGSSDLHDVLAALNEEFNWGLDDNAIRRYSIALQKLLPKDCSPEQLRLTCIVYHADHQLVEILRDELHPRHREEWEWLRNQVAQILRVKKLDWMSDPAITAEDIIQMAQFELARSLARFRYLSSFKTWSYHVVVQTAMHLVRDSLAKKRAQRPLSLDGPLALEVALQEARHPEAEVHCQQLLALATQILRREKDDRLALIFELWASHDRTTEEIAQTVNLHPSRVRALLQEARTLLKNHPAIQQWQSDKK